MRVNPLKWFFETKAVQNFYKKACDPKNAPFFNNTLPTIESLASGVMYVAMTEKQKDIPREQKNVLQYQNVLGTIGGMALGSFLNRKVTKFADKLAPKIDKNIVDVHKVKSGICVGLPILATAVVMRFLVPIATAQASTMIEDYRREKKNKLDVKA